MKANQKMADDLALEMAEVEAKYIIQLIKIKSLAK